MIVIGICNSWYHSLGIASYIIKKIGVNNVDKLLVFSGGLLGCKAELVDFSNLDGFSGILKSVNSWECFVDEVGKLDQKSECLLIAPSIAPFRAVKALADKKINFSLVVCEEGIGSYGGFVQTARANIRERDGLRNKAIGIFSIILKRQYVKKKAEKITYWLNFDAKGVSRDEVVISYQTALSMIQMPVCKKIEDNYDSIFFSSPIVELGIQSEYRYMNQIINILGAESRVIVKPHPAENIAKYKKYNIDVYEEIVSSEVMLRNLPSNINIYALSSTVLYTSNLFYGIKTHRVSGIDFFYNTLSRSQKKIIDNNSKEV